MRYESHRLIYSYSDSEEPFSIGGFLAAAILCVRLINSPEGECREIPLNIEQQPDILFTRYEQEVITDDWGYLQAEVNQLNDAYIQLSVNETDFSDLCLNLRQLSITMNLLTTYMKRLVKEVFREHIWDAEQWKMPFAKWLLDAGYTETRRQRLLNIDWTDPVAVNALVDIPEKAEEPTFLFEDEDANDIIRRYWDWLWNYAQKDAALYPDSNVVMAEYKEKILTHETDWDFIKPEMKDFKPEQINLFRKWMGQWKDFVEQRIKPETPKRQKKDEEQLFFPDAVLTCPTEETEDRYAATREYIKERKKYDKEFAKFVKNESHAKLCRQLTLLFGWYVEPSSLRKSLLRSPKRKTKKYT